MSETSSFDTSLHALLDPARKLLTEVESELNKNSVAMEKIRAERSRLTAQKNEVMKVVRALDPNEPGPGRQNGGKKKPVQKTGRGISDEALERLEEFIRTHYNQGDDFYASAIEQHPDFTAVKGAGIRSGLELLADRGVIRLDRVAKTPKGGAPAKIYRRVGL